MLGSLSRDPKYPCPLLALSMFRVTRLDGDCRQPDFPHRVGSNRFTQRNPIAKESFKLATGFPERLMGRLQGQVKAIVAFGLAGFRNLAVQAADGINSK